MLAVLQHLNAVHKHVADADRELMRLFECRFVGDRVWIEDDDVGKVSRLEISAMIETEVIRGQTRQSSHRFFERYHLFVANIFAEQSGEVAVSTRMRTRFQKRTLRRLRLGVRSK